MTIVLKLSSVVNFQGTCTDALYQSLKLEACQDELSLVKVLALQRLADPMPHVEPQLRAMPMKCASIPMKCASPHTQQSVILFQDGIQSR